MTPSQAPVSVVLLAYNEVEIIETVVRDFYTKVVSKIPGSELIVAEDGSTDGTKEVLERLQSELPQLRIEEGKERLGYVNAFKRAMSLPKTELILFCDCSGKHDPDDFWKMYPLMDTSDLVVGYKINRADPLYRIITTRAFNAAVNTYFGLDFKDINCPFRLFKKSAFLKVSALPWKEKALVNFEMTLRFFYSGFHVKQIPVKHFPRANGESRGLPANKIPKVVKNVIKNFPELKRELKQKSRDLV